METEERSRRRGGSARSSKKGGKCVKVRTAEEEARRREEVKERLREKLELERRALKVVERLLEDGVAEDFLVDCAKFITPANYKDTVEERFIAKLCGYPVCPNKLGKIPNQQYKISTKTNRVYDITERKCFCSNFCYKASKEYELQISKTPLWLRQHESPPEITLLKTGGGGSSGEEVKLSERCLSEEDVENPQAAPPEDLPASQLGDRSQSSDSEQEQEFVSSAVAPRGRPRVHWADLARHTEGDGNRTERRQIPNLEKKGTQDRTGLPAADLNTDASPADRHVEEATAKLEECSVSERTSPPSHPEGFSISQVGVSRKGAVGLRDLLQKHAGDGGPGSVRLNLLDSLRRTLKEWCTEQTLGFLYGADRPLGSPFADVSKTEDEEELDEDDLEDGDEPKRPAAAAPDYETLRNETQRLQLRVSKFYKGTWAPAEGEEPNPNKAIEVDPGSKEPALPPVDSHAQNLIQKRITVEKLSSCLRNIVGPVGLTMSDISTDLNNLVRTFRFTNTNIIHKAPEWTLIAVVLLHLLAGVSPVVQEALELSASVQYVNTLMEELGLQEQDLLTVVRLFKPSTNGPS